jgi:hypothetical protein
MKVESNVILNDDVLVKQMAELAVSALMMWGKLSKNDAWRVVGELRSMVIDDRVKDPPKHVQQMVFEELLEMVRFGVQTGRWPGITIRIPNRA